MLAVGAGWDSSGILFSPLISLFFLTCSEGMARYVLKHFLKEPLNPKTTNQSANPILNTVELHMLEHL